MSHDDEQMKQLVSKSKLHAVNDDAPRVLWRRLTWYFTNVPHDKAILQIIAIDEKVTDIFTDKQFATCNEKVKAQLYAE